MRLCYMCDTHTSHDLHCTLNPVKPFQRERYICVIAFSRPPCFWITEPIMLFPGFSFFSFSILSQIKWNEAVNDKRDGKGIWQLCKVLAALGSWVRHLAFISLSSSKQNGNSISRSGREAFRRLCTETWCFRAGGHICTKCLDLFVYQRRNLGIWMTLTLRLGEVLGVDCAWREVSHFLRPDSLKPGEGVRSQDSLGRRVFHIIKAGLSQGTLSFCLGEDEFSKWLN